MPHIIIDNTELRAPGETVTVTATAAYKEISETTVRRYQVASETSGDAGPLAIVALSLLKQPRMDVAIIGLGMGVLPRLIAHAHRLTCFEIEPEIVSAFVFKHPEVEAGIAVGDYADTLEKVGRMYDVIVYDLGGPVPTDRLVPFLKPGGRIVDPYDCR